MQLTGITLADLTRVTEQVSTDRYLGNVVVHADSRDVSKFSCQGRLWVLDSRSVGARRTGSGRRMPAACWHAYRDVLTALFEELPAARISTGLAAYAGRQSFYDKFEATRNRNIGSLADPKCIADACDCEKIEQNRGSGWATVAQLRAACDAESFYWFDKSATAFHKTRIPEGDDQRLAARHAFRTTDPVSFPGPGVPRGHTVRLAYRYVDTGNITITRVGGVGGWTLAGARRTIAMISQLIERGVPVENVRVHPEFVQYMGDKL